MPSTAQLVCSLSQRRFVGTHRVDGVRVEALAERLGVTKRLRPRLQGPAASLDAILQSWMVASPIERQADTGDTAAEKLRLVITH